MIHELIYNEIPIYMFSLKKSFKHIIFSVATIKMQVSVS